MIATLVVTAVAVLGVGALIGGNTMIAGIVLALVVLVAAVLAVRVAEIALGLVALVVGGVWVLLGSVISLHWGLGIGTEQWFGGAEVDLQVDPWSLALFGIPTLLGFVTLSLGVSFVFGVGPLAKPAKGRDGADDGWSRRGLMAVAVEIALVAVILVTAVLVVNHVYSGPYPEMSSVSNAPGP